MVAEGIGDAVVVTGSVSLVGDLMRIQQNEDRLIGDDDWDESDDEADFDETGEARRASRHAAEVDRANELDQEWN